MGQRSSTETSIGVIAAFFQERTWRQAELAKKVGISPRALRKVLDELVLQGWPLDREEEHPHVYWSLPQGFLPVGVLVPPDDVDALLRVIARSPASPERGALLAAVGRSLPRLAGELIGRVIPGRMSQPEQRMLGAIEDALQAKEAILVRYFSASRGVLSHRVLSVQKVLLGPPARCVGYCHASRALRWFRLDSFTEVERTLPEAFVEVAETEIRAFVEASIDGFAQGERIRVAFRVRNPEARWVAGNLPAGLTARPEKDGIHVECDTAGLVPIARFVVGLGDAAAVETPELAAAVRELAQGALRALDAAQGGQAFSTR